MAYHVGWSPGKTTAPARRIPPNPMSARTASSASSMTDDTVQITASWRAARSRAGRSMG